MSVFKPKNSSMYHYRFMVNGVIKTGSTKTANKQAAERVEALKRTEAHAVIVLGDGERITIEDAFQKFCDSKQKLSSYRDYVARCNKQMGKTFDISKKAYVSCFGFKPSMYLDDLREKDIQRLIIEREKEGVTPQTVTHELSMWGQMNSLMKRLGYKTAVIDMADIKKHNNIRPPKGKLRFLSLDEEERLLAALDPKAKIPGVADYRLQSYDVRKERQDIYDFVVLLLDTGARHTEIAELEWTSVNLLDKTLNLFRPKVRNQSVLELSDRAYDILVRRKATSLSQWVFTDSRGGPRQYRLASFLTACKRAGLQDVTYHTLRHSFASRMVQAGLPITDLQQILGHANITMTMKYAHLSVQDSSRKAAAILNNLGRQKSLQHPN